MKISGTSLTLQEQQERQQQQELVSGGWSRETMPVSCLRDTPICATAACWSFASQHKSIPVKLAPKSVNGINCPSFETDCPMHRHLISYPKSGRTWLRYSLTLLNVADQVRFQHDGSEYKDVSCPQRNFDYDARLERHSNLDRIVYLSRDPRDIMLSLYFQITGRMYDKCPSPDHPSLGPGLTPNLDPI